MTLKLDGPEEEVDVFRSHVWTHRICRSDGGAAQKIITRYVSHTFEGRAGEKGEISFNSSRFPPDLERASRTLCCGSPSSLLCSSRG